MAGIPVPVVRYMLVCDDVWRPHANPNNPIVVGLTSIIQSSSSPPFPMVLDRLCVYLVLTEGRGTGQGHLRLVHEETNQTIWETPPRPIGFPDNPLELSGIIYRVRRCRFPMAGLYNLQFLYDNQEIAHQPLLVREVANG